MKIRTVYAWVVGHADVLLLSLVLIIAAVVRFWGINFGLPQIDVRPDENQIVEMLGQHYNRFRPLRYNYPSLYHYLFIAATGVYGIMGMLSGQFASLVEMLASYDIDPWRFYLVGRVLTAVLGIGTVYATYAVARQAFDRPTALMSAFFLSLAWLHVRDSHFATTDVPMTFFLMGAMVFIVKGMHKPSVRTDLAAAVFAGLAISTKYNAVFIVVPFILAALPGIRQQAGAGSIATALRRITLFLLMTAVAFIAGTPYCLVDAGKILASLALHARHHAAEGHCFILGKGWWYHAQHTLPLGLGWPLVAASVAGVAICCARRFRTALVLFSFPLVYYYAAGNGYTVFVRYMVPMVPFLCIGAAYALNGIIPRIARRWNPQGRHGIVLAVGACMVIMPSAWRTIQGDSLLARKDTRTLAAEWIKANVPDGDTIALTTPVIPSLILPPTRRIPVGIYEGVVRRGLPGRMKKAAIEYWDREIGKGFESAVFDWESRIFRLGNDTLKTVPEYLVVERSPLRCYSKVPATVETLLATEYQLVSSFVAQDSTSGRKSWYDQQDAFFLPYAGFAGVWRPGPDLFIFRRLNKMR